MGIAVRVAPKTEKSTLGFIIDIKKAISYNLLSASLQTIILIETFAYSFPIYTL